MPRSVLQFFPEGVTHISDALAFKREAGEVVYFNCQMPIFAPDNDDHATF